MVSIIVPIYNVERYLRRCVDSLIAQTHSEIEIILVDDGSPDSCGAICDGYSDLDSRVTTHHRQNHGVSESRRFGVENSNGEYIVFVDADDWLPLDAIELLHNNIKNREVDIVIGSVQNHQPDNTSSYYNTIPTATNIEAQTPETLTIKGDEHLRLLLSWEIIMTPWARIYRREIFAATSFFAINQREDLLMHIEMSHRVRRVKFISDIVYCYLNRATSVSKLFASTFEFETRYCAIVKDILVKNGTYDAHKTAYAKCALNAIGKTIYAGGDIDLSDPLIKLIKETLTPADLDAKQRAILWSLKAYIFYKYLYFLNRLKIAVACLIQK